MRILLFLLCFLAVLPGSAVAAGRGGEASPFRTVLQDPNDPAGIAVYGRHIYITDAYTLRVTERTLGGTIVRSWAYGAPLKNKYQSWPAGIAVNKTGVYVSDPNHNRVVRFDLNGKQLAAYAAGFSLPRGVAVDAAGNLYVADWQHDRIVKLSARGSILATWTPPAAARLDTATSHPKMGPPTGSIAPSSIVLAPDGSLYVAGICHDPCEQGGHAFAQYFVDHLSAAGSVLRQWEGNSPYGFEPHTSNWISADALAVTRNGNWFLAGFFAMGGRYVDSVAEYRADGRRLRLWPVNEAEGSVQGLTVDGHGNLWATHSQGPILQIAAAAIAA
ncbi:MAG TPA: SMP-30/gluconolactonase/LRE family protein [Chloroflexota bacterium]|nr:SMP-30/gluconolactonase/LRE family protein [Chloroflexota bacterium]